MNIKTFEQYGYDYPELVYEIVSYFSDKSIKSRYVKANHGVNPEMGYKTTMDFIEHKNSGDIYPELIVKICDILCENRILEKLILSCFNNNNGHFNIYYRFDSIKNTPFMKVHLNNLVYGFKYIYNKNKKNVLPMFVKKKGEPGIGTCFKIVSQNSTVILATAKHCLDVDCIQIGENETLISPKILESAKIYISNKYDIAVIDLNIKADSDLPFMLASAEVLDEIITMGFPQHAGFGNFITTTKGSVAAIEESYIYHHKLMLLTTRIRGGNSGGPVVSKGGYVVGIVTETPVPEKSELSENEREIGLFEYDKFGYGLALPTDYIIEVYNNKKEYPKKINFTDNIDDCW